MSFNVVSRSVTEFLTVVHCNNRIRFRFGEQTALGWATQAHLPVSLQRLQRCSRRSCVWHLNGTRSAKRVNENSISSREELGTNHSLHSNKIFISRSNNTGKIRPLSRTICILLLSSMHRQCRQRTTIAILVSRNGFSAKTPTSSKGGRRRSLLYTPDSINFRKAYWVVFA